jgi:hypothetical protein
MMAHRRGSSPGALISRALMSVGLCGLAACSGRGQSEVPYAAIASIQDIMAAEVDPSADLVWASVSTVTTAAGTEEKRPRTDAEWSAVRRQAITLIEATNLLLVPGRRVAEAGRKTEDANIPGIESAENIQKAIDGNRGGFRLSVLGLRAAGVKTLAAIDAKDPEGLSEAGGQVDAACEACHLKYWYPHSPRPPG